MAHHFLCYLAKTFRTVPKSLKKNISKSRKRIGIIKKPNKTLPQDSDITICKLFERPHLEYGDVIYD